MSLTHPNHAVTEQRLSEFYQAIMPYLNGEPQKIVYGFRIDNSESVPSAKVTYLEDAVGMTPAYMNFSTGKFDYGSWEYAFFMPKPCMLKYDGTVDYYLDPNDYTKKEDGVTASDVANTSYGGNAMMEWPKIWLKIVPDATASNKSADIYIANYKADADYTDWNYHDANGNSADNFYTAIYNGSNINSKLRSISGQAVIHDNTATTEQTWAKANNTTAKEIWNLEKKVDIDLINILLVLMAKSTDTRTSFGSGMRTGDSATTYNAFRTGVHNAKGLFYGTNSSDSTVYTNAVKVFGMENWWGFGARRYLGHIIQNGVQKVKLTYGTEDGSTSSGFNFTGSGYISSGAPSITGYSGGQISQMYFSNKAIIPCSTSNGSMSTHYCDGFFFNTSSNTYVPCHCGNGHNTSNGAFFIFGTFFESGTGAQIGATISAKPLVPTT